MYEYVPFIGDRVYIYSTSLDEVIEGIVEGYVDEDRRRYKILQPLGADESMLRHIVSYIYVFKDKESAVECRQEFLNYSSIELRVGNIVYLLDSYGAPVTDHEDIPLRYQITAVYKETQKVGLATSYGEYVGSYGVKNVLFVGEGPLFRKEDYEVNTVVVWADGEDVFEGTISALNNSTAKVIAVKKLMPINYSVNLPYWKIPEGRKSIQENTINVVHTIIGDDLD